MYPSNPTTAGGAFLRNVPAGLHADLIVTLRTWRGSRDSAHEVIAELRHRLAHALGGDEVDAGRRDDLAALLNALHAHRRSAVSLVNSIYHEVA